jgi:hypothetical protein
MSLNVQDLKAELGKIIDTDLARIAVDSYIETQNRFLIGDWKPSELNGGALCEAVSRCLYQLDTGRVTHKKSVSEIREYLLDAKAVNPHKLSSKDRRHISNAIEIAYKFRSDRGVAHISKDYDANLMDSMLLVHLGKWIFAEFLRLAWNKDRNVIAEIIARLVQIDHALIHELDGTPLVLATNLTAQEEILILLNHATDNRLSRSAIKAQAPHLSPQQISGAVSLMEKKFRQVRPTQGGELALTPNGSKRILEEIIPKININE